jgi:hypothetical protein
MSMQVEPGSQSAFLAHALEQMPLMHRSRRPQSDVSEQTVALGGITLQSPRKQYSPVWQSPFSWHTGWQML